MSSSKRTTALAALGGRLRARGFRVRRGWHHRRHDAGSGAAGGAQKGGTNLLAHEATARAHGTQRTYIGRDIFNPAALVYRNLVQFRRASRARMRSCRWADVATDAGKSSDGAKKWTFTIKDGVKWEDGKPRRVRTSSTASRANFATDGPQRRTLDLPPQLHAFRREGLQGALPQEGPGRLRQGRHLQRQRADVQLREPWADFPLAVAGLNFAAPFRQEKDQGDKNNYVIFSNGPYKAEGGKWTKGTGATFVRNDQYDPSRRQPAGEPRQVRVHRGV